MKAVNVMWMSIVGICAAAAGSAHATHAAMSSWQAGGIVQHSWNRFSAHQVDPFFVPSTPTEIPAPRGEPATATLTIEDVFTSMQPRAPRDHLLEVAGGLVGTRSMRWMDPSVPDECSGYVRASYAAAGVDILWAEPRFDENAVGAIYRMARERGATHMRTPDPGDLVFFRETYDRNRDGLRNDGRTHIGIVERVEADGTVVFLHRIRQGVMRSRMNTAKPRVFKDPSTGVVLNDWLRGPKNGYRAYLTGELFAGYASFAVLSSTDQASPPMVAAIK